ncbi:beta strand repeat-containing protein, partial [Brasilonema bromeliae]
NPALLTVNPSALFFNQIAAAARIENNSASAGKNPAGFDAFGLRVPDGKSLLLVGGNISMQGGRLNAYGGRVELGGLISPGNVGLNVDGNKLSLDFPASSTRADISLTNGASVFVQAGGGGDIVINSRNLEVSGSQLIAGFGEGLGNAGAKAGDITLGATEQIKVVNSYIFNNVGAGAAGNGGNIRINADSLSVFNGAQLSAATLGKGDAGSVIIDARKNVSFDGVRDRQYPSAAFGDVGQGGEGNGGGIYITTGELSVTNGAQLQASTYGKGDAGNVIIDASKRVSFDGVVDGVYTFNSYAASYVVNGAQGKGGNIQITTGELSVTNGARLQTYTNGKGDAGNVIIDASKDVSFDGSSIFSIVGQKGEGNGGNIRINADSLSVFNGAQLQAITNGKGDAGNVIIDARKDVSFDGSSIFSIVGQTGEGKGGNIRINADSLSVFNGAQLQATTNGKGDGGSVIINARKNVSFDGVRDRQYPSAAFGDVGQGGEGNGGGIYITTGELSVTNGAQLQASTYGKGDAGNVIIDASKRVSFDGVVDGVYTFNSYAASYVVNGAQGKGGNIQITTGELSVTNGAQIYADTAGKGDAGNIQIKANNSISVFGTSSISGSSSALFTSTTSTGKGGNIIVDTNAFRTSDGGVLNAQTFNDGEGGSITVTAKLVEVLNGGQLLATSSGNGRAGKITVNATDRIIVNGTDATYVDRVKKFGTKVPNAFATKGVDNVSVDEVNKPASGLFVRSQSSGSAGDIEVTSPQIRLDNSGRFIAESASGNGGNITLQIRDLLLLRGGSLISATAGTAQAGGNGGKIEINTPKGFIVAFPGQNNDITANAFNGSGGVVKIKAAGIYEIKPLSRDDLEGLPPTDRDPRKLPTNDITAVSQEGGPQLDGLITINNPNADLSYSFVSLPADVFDPSKQIAQGCSAFDQPNASDFKVTGRGGLPPSPDEPLSSDAVWEDTRLGATTAQRLDSKTTATKPKSESDTVEIIPATGWVFNGKGEVTLVSNGSSTNNLGTTPATCLAR